MTAHNNTGTSRGWFSLGGLAALLLVLFIGAAVYGVLFYQPPPRAPVERQTAYVAPVASTFSEEQVEERIQAALAEERAKAGEQPVDDDAPPATPERPRARTSTVPQGFTEVRPGWGYRRFVEDGVEKCQTSEPGGASRAEKDEFFREWCTEYTENVRRT